MSSYQRAVPVLQVANVEASLRWYVEKKVQPLRGPERMFYGLVEFEVCDPDGYRVCVGGEAPPGVNVKLHEKRDTAP